MVKTCCGLLRIWSRIQLRQHPCIDHYRAEEHPNNIGLNLTWCRPAAAVLGETNSSRGWIGQYDIAIKGVFYFNPTAASSSCSLTAKDPCCCNHCKKRFIASFPKRLRIPFPVFGELVVKAIRRTDFGLSLVSRAVQNPCSVLISLFPQKIKPKTQNIDMVAHITPTPWDFQPLECTIPFPL